MSVRTFAGLADLRAMQELVQRTWTHGSRLAVGDLVWGRLSREDPGVECPTALWEQAGRVLAFGQVELPALLELVVDPERPELVGEVIAWFEGVATSPSLAAAVLEPAPGVGDGEAHLVAGLEAAGYAPVSQAPFDLHMSRSLDELPDPVLPPGYRARAVRGVVDVGPRAAVHRAAWEPSKVTARSYRRLMEAWPYRADLDWVIEAPDGELVSSCCLWLDDVNRVVELEPVGTHPGHRGRGLAAAVCLAALAAARSVGAREAIVYPRGDDDYPAPARLYRRLGFAPRARSRLYRRSRNV